ncbi:MAG TPA: aspartyl protease family protein, partial [Nannocystaceae bacterium]|nr:aspartyl protease family protein [Nannocystaceae bacterium]
MLIDSGADITVLPESAAAQLGVEVVDEVLTKVFDGSLVRSKVVEVDLKLGKGRFPGRYLLAPCEAGLLGRDVL